MLYKISWRVYVVYCVHQNMENDISNDLDKLKTAMMRIVRMCYVSSHGRRSSASSSSVPSGKPLGGAICNLEHIDRPFAVQRVDHRHLVSKCSIAISSEMETGLGNAGTVCSYIIFGCPLERA